MAIDSQEKRMSAATAGRPFMRATFPSGTIDQAERLSIGHAYNGNVLGVVTNIDTQAKRMCAAGAGRPFMRAHFPGTINEAWRLGVGNAYCGNVLTPAAGGANPHGPLGHPLYGPFAGPVAA